MAKQKVTSSGVSASSSSQDNSPPSYLVEFDLESLLVYAMANPGLQDRGKPDGEERRGHINTQTASPENFTIIHRKSVFEMQSPVLLHEDFISPYLGGGVSRSAHGFHIDIGNFEFRNRKPGDPSVTIFKIQRGQIKRGPLLSMQVIDPSAETEISSEIYFLVSRLKKCKSHFVLSEVRLAVDLLPRTNKVVVHISYKLDIVTSFYRYFSSDISQSLDAIVRPQAQNYPTKGKKCTEAYDSLPKDNHLFYKVITDKTSLMPPASQSFYHPHLQTKLLPFQKKSVQWLLSQEGMEYNEHTHECTYIPVVSPELSRALRSFPRTDCEWLDQQISQVFPRLCFGWRRILFGGNVCWYNNYTGNIMSERQAVEFLRSYAKESNPAPFPGCGLLSEEMGLGKTVEVTTLIQLNSRPQAEVGAPISLQFKDGGDLRHVKKGKTTIIAAPESILRQWYTEICQICPTLSVTIYKGLGKYPELSNIPQYIAEFLQSYDVVLLNYSTLSRETDYANYSSRHKPTRGGKKRNSEGAELSSDTENYTGEHTNASALSVDSYKADFVIPEFSNQNEVALSQKKYERTVMTNLARKIARRDPSSISHTQYYESPLMSCQWWRVVLDEVQMVSSGSTRAFATASILPRFHSWGVSGTPSISPAVLQFLRFSPFNYEIQKHCWKLLTSAEEGNESFVDMWSSLAIRHTKNMVYDDIKLPSQQRILLTIPFTEVEQDKYKEVLESTLAYIGIYDISTGVEKDVAFESSSYSHLRTSLVKLRQLCGNLQVGKLPKTHTIKGRNKTKLLITGVKELKTLGNVLVDMIEGVQDDISECERALVNRVLEICSSLEYVFYPERVIQVLDVLLSKIHDLMAKVSHRNEENSSRFKQIRAVLIKKDALPRESLGDMSDSEDESDFDADSTNTTKAEPLPSGRVKMESEDSVIDDAQLSEHLADFHKLKERVATERIRFRSWKMIQHKCLFLLASAHFQLYDPEYQDKITRLKVPFDAADRVLHTIENCGFFQKEITKEEATQEILMLAGSSDDATEKIKAKEKRYYELAEQCRRDILKHSTHEAQRVTARRIGVRSAMSADDWTNDGEKSFPKSTKKLFMSMPTISVSAMTDRVSHMKWKQLVDQFQQLARKLNLQVEVINKLMTQLLTVLTNPLNNSENDANGEEFDQSVQDQERASCLMLVISQMLMDRSNAVLESKMTITEIERQRENEFKQEVQRVNDRTFLKELQKARLSVKPDVHISMEELLEDARLLELSFRNTKAGADHDNSLAILGMLRTMFENEKTCESLLKKELNSTFNIVFNSRVEYFRQLQQISDSVQNESLKFPQDKFDPDSLEVLFQNLFRNLAMSQSKLTKSVTRLKYLSSLLPESAAAKHEPGDREDIICIICQSPITVGSLTLCGHKFCKDCLDEWLKRSSRCPMCKTQTDRTMVYGFTSYKGHLKAQHLDAAHDLSHSHKPENSNVNQIYKQLDDETLHKVQSMSLANSYGSKVDLIVKQVLYLRSTDPDVQIVIFSQWQDLLVILAFAFDKMDISYVSAKESHVASKKRNSDPVQEFKDQSNIKTCFLLNAQAQSSGLTLINATHIFLCEPLINTSTELQAISRIHRIGQKKQTTVWMFAIENTLEANIVALGTNRRIEYFRANAKESNAPVANNQPQNSSATVLEENELRAAESFALTLGSSSGKKVPENSEFVADADLHKIYFGINPT